MPGFDEAWTHVSGIYEGEALSPDLKPLVRAVYSEIMKHPSDLEALKLNLEALLSYLAGPSGRTNANCRATDLFFCLRDGWEGDWNHLPREFADILGDLGGALHDTVRHPEIARSVDSLPEQILARVRELPNS